MASRPHSVFNAITWLLVSVTLLEVHSSRVISSDGEIEIAGEEAKDDPQLGLGVVIRPEGEIEQIEPVAEAESFESSSSQSEEQEISEMSSSRVSNQAKSLADQSENSSDVSGQLEEAMIEFTSSVNDTRTPPQSPVSAVPPAPGLSPGDATQRLAQRLGIPTENSCLHAAEGSYMGCNAGCRCAWAQQCYPKYVYIDNMNSGAAGGDLGALRVNIGICETAMFVLLIISIAVFFAALASVFACRLYFEWREKISCGTERIPPRPDVGASGSGSVSRRTPTSLRANSKQEKGARAGSKRRDSDDGAAISKSEASCSAGIPDNTRM